MTYALGLGAGRPRPAFLAAFSGFIPTVRGWEPELTPPLPRVAIGHGVYDPVIGVEWGRAAQATLEQAGADVLYREYPLPHALDPRFLVEVGGAVSRVLERRRPAVSVGRLGRPTLALDESVPRRLVERRQLEGHELPDASGRVRPWRSGAPRRAVVRRRPSRA